MELDADSEVWNVPLMPGWPPDSGLESANWQAKDCCGNFSKWEETVQGEVPSTL